MTLLNAFGVEETPGPAPHLRGRDVGTVAALVQAYAGWIGVVGLAGLLLFLAAGLYQVIQC
jgi:hypothetical protein